MKSQKTLYRIALSLLFIFSVGLPASAQSSGYQMTVQVPFEFQVDGKLMPAGHYVIKRLSQTSQFLLIQSAARETSVVVPIISTNLSRKPNRSSLTFKLYGEKHVLSEVKNTKYNSVYSLIGSKDQRKLALAAEASAIVYTDPVKN